MREPDATLLEGELLLHGRLMRASNASFVGRIENTTVVYKPVAGERPLWDFPEGTLADRERAAYLVSEALGWDVVPLTFLRGGPHGPGMVQIWQEPSETDEAVTVVRARSERPGWLHVFDGVDEHDHPVSLVHEDSPGLRRMAVFDAVVNNADRKGGHVLAMPGGHRFGVDHGVSFHVEPKLRTVLWGWAGEPLDEDERQGLSSLLSDLEGDLGDLLGAHLTPREVDSTRRRVSRLLRTAAMPVPRGDWPAIPWPPF